MKNKRLAIFFLIFTAFSGGAMIPLVKIILKIMPPMTFTFLRFSVATAVILPFVLREKPHFSDCMKVLLPSIFASLNIIIFILAIDRTSANLGQTVYVMVPVIVVILSGLVLREKITGSKIIGVLLGVLGSLLLLFSETVIGYSSSDNLLGGLMIFVGALFFSMYVILSKKIQKTFSPMFISFSYFITTTVLSLFFSLREIGGISTWYPKMNMAVALYVVVVALIGTSLYYFLQQLTIKYGSATLGSAINFVQPAFTFIWASLLLGEKITTSFLVAAIMIIIGAIMVSK